jgi:aminopeptidase N
MSTYLVAMVVGDFACRAGHSDGTDIRICSTPDKQNLTAFALEAAQHQLKFFNDYFGIRYPFGKLDIIAVPDFAAGAMENAGAITFRERLLLIDPERSSVTVRKSVASIISHEIAHQWFGNLVTMKWWDDIWLNEGFATWMANKPLAEWRPEWQVSLDDADATQAALGLDALRSTRPIRTKVETNDQINEVFDGIAYQKTAAVLRMIEAYVGPASFQKAINSYLTKLGAPATRARSPSRSRASSARRVPRRRPRRGRCPPASRRTTRSRAARSSTGRRRRRRRPAATMSSPTPMRAATTSPSTRQTPPGRSGGAPED